MSEAEFERWLLEQLEQVEPIEAEVKPFADPGPIFSYATHLWICGKTGSGKSVLLHTLQELALNKFGYKIIHRDDGGWGFLKLAGIVDEIVLWVPEGCEIYCEHPDVIIRHFDIHSPGWLADELIRTSHTFNVIMLYDALNSDSKPYEAMFYDSFLGAFLNRMMTMHPEEKKHTILSFDELNDIIQSPRMELGPVYASVRAKLELHFRKMRKHDVHLWFTSHRVKDIPPSLRNNVDFLFIKRMKYMYDVYIALNYMLVLLKYLFWRIMARIKNMGPEEFFMVDRDGNWDFYQIPNLPEELPRYGVRRQLNMEEELNPKPFRGREKWAEIRKWVKATLLAMKNRIELGTEAYSRIAERLGFSSPGPVGNTLVHNVFSDPELKDLFDEIIAELSSSKGSEIYNARANAPVPVVKSK